MTLFHSKNAAFDINTAELVLFYIDDYKMFKKQGFCLMPQYKISEFVCEKDECFVVKLGTKEDFIDLFEDENINVMILCGKNGCGKSTLLNLIADKESPPMLKKSSSILMFSTCSISLSKSISLESVLFLGKTIFLFEVSNFGSGNSFLSIFPFVV